MAHGIASLQKTFNKCLIDNRHFRRRQGIGVAKIAPLAKGNAERSKEIRTYGVPAHYILSPSAFAIENRIRVVAPTRADPIAHESNRQNAGNRPKLAKHARVKGDFLFILRRAELWAEAENEQSIALEPKVRPFQIAKAARQQAGGNGKHQTQRHLRHDNQTRTTRSRLFLKCCGRRVFQRQPNRHTSHSKQRRYGRRAKQSGS